MASTRGGDREKVDFYFWLKEYGMISILHSIVDRAGLPSIRLESPVRPTAPRTPAGTARRAYGTRTIGVAFPLILAAAVVVLPAPASAITPQQCQVLNNTFLKLMKYQSTILDQSEILLRQRSAISGSIASITNKHPELTESDFEELKKVGGTISDAAASLNPGSDLATLNQEAAQVLADLCP